MFKIVKKDIQKSNSKNENEPSKEILETVQNFIKVSLIFILFKFKFKF